MKKIAILGLSVLAFAAVSCDINKAPEFDDADAFVQFSSTSLKFSETDGKVSIPVHATSLSLPATTVSYKVIDGTAKLGEDFKLVDNSGVASIAAGSSEANIAIEIIPNVGVFTGDKTFSLEITSAGSMNLGYAKTISITIADTDHPLSAFLGTWVAESLVSYWGDDYSGSEIEIVKDSDDVSMLWIYNLDAYFASYGYTSDYGYNIFYGNVNDDKTEISIPVGQEVGYSTVSLERVGDGPIVFNVSEDGKTLTCEHMWGVYSSGWWELYSTTKFVKVEE